MRKIMLDLETLGTKPGYVVLAIGAVLFDRDGPSPADPNDGFYLRLEVEQQHAVGLRTDPDTALWWMKQSQEAREAITAAAAVPLQPALAAFADWVETVAGGEEDDQGNAKVEVWGNGANFDAPMLREVFLAAGIKCPWAWWNERCYRTERNTLKALIKRYSGVDAKDPDRTGTHHDALSDAQHQATVYGHLHQQLDTVIEAYHAGA